MDRHRRIVRLSGLVVIPANWAIGLILRDLLFLVFSLLLFAKYIVVVIVTNNSKYPTAYFGRSIPAALTQHFHFHDPHPTPNYSNSDTQQSP